MKNETLSEDILEQLQQAISRPETMTQQQAEQWANDPELADACQTMMDVRRALAESHYEAHGDSTHEAFDRFKASHQPTATIATIDSRRKSWLTAAIAVAACMAAWLFLPTQWNKQDHQQLDNLLHQATPSEVAYTITEGTDTIATSPTALQLAATVKNITMQGNTITYAPLDLSKYQICKSTLSVAQGHTALITLPDGTRVWLNAQSNLVYPNHFADNQPRQVELQGEAYFEVTPDANRPFIVNCGKMQALVLGTSFNIRNYPESEPCITLTSGSVKITTKKQNVTLVPNQSATLTDDNQLAVAPADVELATCWREGQFYFEGKTLREILVEIGRWNNTDVVIRDSNHLDERLHFRGERQWKVTELADALSIICDVRLTMENGALVLY